MATLTSKFIFESKFYPQVADGDRLNSEEFLSASRVIVDFLDSLGKIFYPVRADINGHIEKVNKLVTSDRVKFETLDAILDPSVAVDNKDKKKRNEAVISLTWLKRACAFIHHFLLHLCNEETMSTEDLKPFFREAYESHLKVHHNIIAQKLFQVCVHAAPSRTYMVDILTSKGERSTEQVYSIIRAFLTNMEANIACLVRTFDRFSQQQ